MRWLHPWLLLLLPLLAVLVFVRRRKGIDRPATLAFSAVGWLPARGPDRSRTLLRLAHALGLVFATVALARPQQGLREDELSGRGVDIVLALDVSTSMRAEDFQPDNRLAVAKQVAANFVTQRRQDRIGLVVFAGTAVTLCPLTLNHGVLIDFLQRVDFGMVEDGTAIGQGLATALNRLRESRAKSKVVILLTDGDNNRGAVDPMTAAEMARALGVRVYTIGVGTSGIAPIPVEDPVFGLRYDRLPVRIDEPTLRAIAKRSGGAYFRARDRNALAAIYRQIDRLEKSDLTSKLFIEYRDRGPELVTFAALLFASCFGLALTLWGRIP